MVSEADVVSAAGEATEARVAGESGVASETEGSAQAAAADLPDDLPPAPTPVRIDRPDPPEDLPPASAWRR